MLSTRGELCKFDVTLGGKAIPLSPPADEPDNSPQSPFCRYGKFQSSVRAELTSYQFKVSGQIFTVPIASNTTTVVFCHASTQDEKQCSSTTR